MAKRSSPVVPLPGDPAPTPGLAYWLIITVGAPLLTIAALVLPALATGLVGLTDGAGLVVCVAVSAALGALLPQVLPRVRSLPRTTRVGWTITGGLAAAVSMLPVGFVVLFGLLIAGCMAGTCEFG